MKIWYNERKKGEGANLQNKHPQLIITTFYWVFLSVKSVYSLKSSNLKDCNLLLET